MKRIAIAVFAIGMAVALAGCGSLGTIGTVLSGNVTNPVTPKLVLELRAGYDAAFLVPAATYSGLPRCSHAPAPCSQQAIVDQLRKADAVVKAALDDATALALSSPKIDARGAYDIAVAAITNAERIAAAYNIGSK